MKQSEARELFPNHKLKFGKGTITGAPLVFVHDKETKQLVAHITQGETKGDGKYKGGCGYIHESHSLATQMAGGISEGIQVVMVRSQESEDTLRSFLNSLATSTQRRKGGVPDSTVSKSWANFQHLDFNYAIVLTAKFLNGEEFSAQEYGLLTLSGQRRYRKGREVRDSEIPVNVPMAPPVYVGGGGPVASLAATLREAETQRKEHDERGLWGPMDDQALELVESELRNTIARLASLHKARDQGISIPAWDRMQKAFENGN